MKKWLYFLKEEGIDKKKKKRILEEISDNILGCIKEKILSLILLPTTKTGKIWFILSNKNNNKKYKGSCK